MTLAIFGKKNGISDWKNFWKNLGTMPVTNEDIIKTLKQKLEVLLANNRKSKGLFR